MAAPVMGDDAEALAEEEQHLRVPVICAERPAMVEVDRLSVLRTAVLVEDLVSVTGSRKAFSFSLNSRSSNLRGLN